VVCNPSALSPCRIAASTFSIRNRIEWSATDVEPNTVLAFIAFSIRNRIEWSATKWRAALVRCECNFQYPQPDRVVCNEIPRFVLQPLLDSFSIRNRIEWSATCFERRRLSQTGPFSIRNRIEWSATKLAGHGILGRL